VSIRVVDDGYDFEVAIVDEAWVFRFARRDGVVAALETEIALLPRIAPALPVAVPAFEVVSREPPFVAYRLIGGEPHAGEDAAGVRAFVETLHALDPRELPIRRDDWVGSYRARCDEFARVVLPLLPADRHDRARALFAEADTLTGFVPALVHADLGPEHMLVRDGRLVGVIDWAAARVGDPALDYAWLLNGPFPDWEVDPELRRRAGFYHRLAPWYEAHYGMFVESREHLEGGLAGIAERL
jgi:aminoglycoside phosphotransferase (APT) family kinase protein